MKHLLSLLLPAALLVSCETSYQGHARIHRLKDLPPTAQRSMVAPGILVPEDVYPLPQTHSGFTYMPSYPLTFTTWKDEAFIRGMKGFGQRRIVINLATQRGLFFIDGKVAMDFPVCTGTADKPTPRGSFTITQKNVHHRSNIYHVAMPYFMRLTNDGIGLHVGYVARRPASHGCIRVPKEACKLLFAHVSTGTPVDIH